MAHAYQRRWSLAGPRSHSAARASVPVIVRSTRSASRSGARWSLPLSSADTEPPSTAIIVEVTEQLWPAAGAGVTWIPCRWALRPPGTPDHPVAVSSFRQCDALPLAVGRLASSRTVTPRRLSRPGGSASPARFGWPPTVPTDHSRSAGCFKVRGACSKTCSKDPRTALKISSVLHRRSSPTHCRRRPRGAAPRCSRRCLSP